MRNKARLSGYDLIHGDAVARLDLLRLTDATDFYLPLRATAYHEPDQIGMQHTMGVSCVIQSFYSVNGRHVLVKIYCSMADDAGDDSISSIIVGEEIGLLTVRGLEPCCKTGLLPLSFYN